MNTVWTQDPWRDGKATANNILNVLNNNKKTNFQESLSDKSIIWNKSRAHSPCHPPRRWAPLDMQPSSSSGELKSFFGLNAISVVVL